MRNKRKHYDIERIVHNAETLSDPQVYESFLYECEDPEGFAEIENEITELSEILPAGISVLDLPSTICGNRKTKVYGKATCVATNGHLILNSDNPYGEIFDSIHEAEAAGYRPCSKCMKDDYLKWKKEGGAESGKDSILKNC